MKWRVAVAIVLAALGWLAGAAHGAVRLVGTGELIGADRDHAAWRTSDGAVVFNARSGRRVAVPAPRADCAATGVGAGLLLFSCTSRTSPADLGPTIWRLRDRSWSVRTAPAALDLGNVDGIDWVGAGRSWLRARVRGYHFDVTRFLSRATPEVFPGQPYGATTTPDLDAPRLTRSVCGPGAPQPVASDPYETRDPYGPVQLSHGWALAGGAVVLWRCGADRTETLCSAACSDGVIRGRDVMWVEDGRVAARRLTGGRVRWLASRYRVMAAAPVGRLLVLSVTVDPRSSPRIATAPMP